jgi:hypothetical protein
VFVQISNQAVQIGLAESLVNSTLCKPVLGEPPAIGQQSLRKCTTNCIEETGRMSPSETTHGVIAGEVDLPADYSEVFIEWISKVNFARLRPAQLS